MSANDFTPARIDQLRAMANGLTGMIVANTVPVNSTSYEASIANGEWLAMLDAIEELQAELKQVKDDQWRSVIDRSRPYPAPPRTPEVIPGPPKHMYASDYPVNEIPMSQVKSVEEMLGFRVSQRLASAIEAFAEGQCAATDETSFQCAVGCLRDKGHAGAHEWLGHTWE